MIFWRSTAACFSFAISRDGRRKGDGRGGCYLVWSTAKAKSTSAKNLIRRDPQKRRLSGVYGDEDISECISGVQLSRRVGKLRGDAS